MAHMKQILAVSLACIATGSAFVPCMHLPRSIARSTASKGIRMQVGVLFRVQLCGVKRHAIFMSDKHAAVTFISA